MSENEPMNRPDDTLSVADVERALVRARSRGQHLLRRRSQRRAALGGLAIAALLAGGFGVLQSIDDGASVVVTPAGSGGDTVLAPAASTTTSPPVPTIVTTTTAPLDFTTVGTIHVASAPSSYPGGPADPRPTTSVWSGAPEIGEAAVLERAEVVAMAVVSPSALRATFACVGTADRLTLARYFLMDGVVHIDAFIQSVPSATGCSGDGVTVELPFPEGNLPAEVRWVMEPLEE